MTEGTVVLIVVVLLVLLVVVSLIKAVQIIPQATAAVIERLGRYKGTAEPGLAFLVPFIDKVRERIDLREQVVSFPPQPVITQDNLTVNIDTVVYFQVTDPKAAVYEISDYITGVEQITTTTLRNVVGGMTLEGTLTSRDQINTVLRGELDEATGRWGIRVGRVEIKAIDPPASIQESMERQMKADREKRAMILTAEGQRESAIRSAEGNKQSQILTAEGAKQAAILNAEAERQSRILRAQGERAAQYLQAQGQAKAIEKVFAAIKAARPTPELLTYQYLQTLPEMAKGEANKVWIVPSDFGKALEGFTRMLGVPGEDGVFRFEPSPVEDTVSLTKPEDDDESIKGWFDTASDPEIAKVVADAEAQARKEVPPIGAPIPATPSPQTVSAPRAPSEPGPAYGAATPREGRPQSPTPSPTPSPTQTRQPESAVPTPPHGIPQVPTDRGGVRGNGGPRPGYPAPPPQ
ncbi:regulator of protease activity HflC (stomatin/prohibitin superfamily) [Pseudonocardia hierapolitana]|uniref:Regulator of protease activity HflC (Stomatin/prohibitin superfamily) n=1 Tax=Pseudonocardia hierapolitana TaxID=1128676 RepID=A0A561T3D9_9PSEU|nr:SPFH domain-containing protein [Pseudonocardia hierapolitana]TWF81615.1 regulator of protease activity HflC (stomatin/prohibitin superfamily) [Pseudonocardia hierapolitana]